MRPFFQAIEKMRRARFAFQKILVSWGCQEFQIMTFRMACVIFFWQIVPYWFRAVKGKPCYKLPVLTVYFKLNIVVGACINFWFFCVYFNIPLSYLWCKVVFMKHKFTSGIFVTFLKFDVASEDADFFFINISVYHWHTHVVLELCMIVFAFFYGSNVYKI